MSVCLIAMVRDEVDVIEGFVRHAAANVDELIIADNLSSDGTREILDELARELPLAVVDDRDPAYLQSRKTTALAQHARKRGHSWVIPADADEMWLVADDPERRLADYLASIPPDVQIVSSVILNHIPSALDDESESNPLRRIQWRKRHAAPMPKVACRTHGALVIEAGNHAARYFGRRALSSTGLALRHFSWRTEDQFLHKIRVGCAAYAATTLSEDFGAHWRMFADASDDDIREHFQTWFYSHDPVNDDSLIHDPAPLRT